MLLITTGFSLNISAGDSDDPELKDLIYDVVGTLPAGINKRIDIVSAWFFEEESSPENLYISLKILDLNANAKVKTFNLYDNLINRLDTFLKNSLMGQFLEKILPKNNDEYQAVYAVTWLMYNNNFYSTLLHKNPDGSIYSSVGASRDDNSIIDNWYEVESTFDEQSNIITWTIPKDIIDNPYMGIEIRDIMAHSHLRKLSDTEGPDLAKDLTLNPLIKEDYIIKY
jgi:hypothetical protein